jgi:hypothetical protein
VTPPRELDESADRRRLRELGYAVQFASWVGEERDGRGLELMAPDDTYLAEIYLDDATGEQTFNGLGPLSLPPDVLRWFLAEAEREFGSR